MLADHLAIGKEDQRLPPAYCHEFGMCHRYGSMDDVTLNEVLRFVESGY
jgi:hypothetical protein